jgi:hypothetical protein
MLTVDVAAMPLGEWQQRWVIEADMEYGHATAGQAAVELARDGHGGLYVESAGTGGCYTEPAVIDGDVEAWFAERHFIAVFPDEAAMWAGGGRLATALGERLPVGVHQVITGPREAPEAGM